MFTLHQTDSGARLGQLHTAHGVIDTPAFMPVGTLGTVKAMTVEAIAQTGTQIILGNTYHLMLRPGADRIERFGGLHQFMNWNKPILTDSGGFQVMSLAKLRKINEDGVTFQSHLDGSKHLLSPEKSIQIQHQLGSDITMCFDECPPYPITKDKAEQSMQLSMRWAKRCKETFVERKGYHLFGIVQGSTFKDLREQSAKELLETEFDGYAIGGLAVGEGQDLMFETLENTIVHLPENKSHYLMGVGKPGDILGAVERGVDMFDCVIPTRSGRTGQAFTSSGTLNIRNQCHQDDPAPLDPTCTCPTCRNYSRSYLHHLFRCEEILGIMLLTWHNVHFYQTLMKNIRTSIQEKRFAKFKKDFLEKVNL